MTTSEAPHSYDLDFKTIFVENPWDSITFAMPKCVEFFKHPPEIVPIREETLNKYLDFLTYYFKLDKKDWEVYQDYKRAKQEGEADMTRSFLVEQGKLEGKVEGKVEASRDLALLLLPKKLGPMPTEIEQAIRALNDVNRLQNIMARFMEINNWQQLQQYLN